jgi:hypothetical protein
LQTLYRLAKCVFIFQRKQAKTILLKCINTHLLPAANGINHKQSYWSPLALRSDIGLHSATQTTQARFVIFWIHNNRFQHHM